MLHLLLRAERVKFIAGQSAGVAKSHSRITQRISI